MSITKDIPSLKKAHNRSLIDSSRPSSTKVLINDEELINFSSNDYLGLSMNPLLIEGAKEFLLKYGTGNGSSRLVSGNNAHYSDIEKKLASFVGKEKAVIFNSGYQANISILPTIADRESLILIDKLSHRSLIEGARNAPGKMVRFTHKNYNQLEKLLIEARENHPSNSIWIVSDTLFSMDGDFADIKILETLSKRYNARLYLDEAHAIGIYGNEGKGLCYGYDVDIVMGTFGKAFGSFGAFLSCDDEIQEKLINKCPGLIYTTALPPSVLGSIDAAITHMGSFARKRHQLIKQSAIMRSSLIEMGWDIGPSQSHIIPLIIKDEKRTVLLSKKLMEKKLYLYPMREPTVPAKSSRLRISLSSKHSSVEVKELLSSLSELKHLFE